MTSTRPRWIGIELNEMWCDAMRCDVMVVYMFMHDQLSVIDDAKILFYNKYAVPPPPNTHWIYVKCLYNGTVELFWVNIITGTMCAMCVCSCYVTTFFALSLSLPLSFSLLFSPSSQWFGIISTSCGACEKHRGTHTHSQCRAFFHTYLAGFNWVWLGIASVTRFTLHFQYELTSCTKADDVMKGQGEDKQSKEEMWWINKLVSYYH